MVQYKLQIQRKLKQVMQAQFFNLYGKQNAIIEMVLVYRQLFREQLNQIPTTPNTKASAITKKGDSTNYYLLNNW